MKSASGSFTKRANHAVLAWYQLHEFAVGPKDSVKRYLKTRSVQWNSRKTALDSFSKVRLHHHPYGFYCPPFWEAHILDSPWGSTVSSTVFGVSPTAGTSQTFDMEARNGFVWKQGTLMVYHHFSYEMARNLGGTGHTAFSDTPKWDKKRLTITKWIWKTHKYTFLIHVSTDWFKGQP